ncbi:DUF4917 family protein [Terasakiella sp. A23]|uniref:DUF4917 family protein n=1 Tax=Terasakiella sp. FCG-A23 TaxID=3080561 RepID=UPI0029556730|nr:DUF4917 family protein [Terasakiella sp. A23]MDV7338060.1 DUF4917 family protein [Terasakiella sp. A23]
MIQKWIDIKDNFNDAIVVGNGGSRAVSGAFAYRSLLEKARQDGHVNEELTQLFERFKTEDFENLLRKLWYAQQVNDVLDIESDAIGQAYETIQGALAQAVRSAHCTYTDALPYFGEIATFLSQFKTIFSLNYDLITYWVMMHSNDNQNTHKFKDCFVKAGGGFEFNWGYLRSSQIPNQKVSLVFYPHGALSLLIGEERSVKKIINDEGASYLETIIDNWEAEKNPPLIICDGNSESKKRNIINNKYLSDVYQNALPNSGPSLTVYGWSMGPQEQHIIDQIMNGNYERIACSVHQPQTQSGEDFMASVQRKFRDTGIEVTFFDAACSGCWVNPLEEVAAE